VLLHSEYLYSFSVEPFVIILCKLTTSNPYDRDIGQHLSYNDYIIMRQVKQFKVGGWYFKLKNGDRADLLLIGAQEGSVTGRGNERICS